jgi:multiple sugar transport system substrate-binding protein
MRIARVLAAGLAVPFLLTTACGSDPGAGVELRVLDYYTDEPSHTNTENRLAACAAEVGARIEHQSVPSPQLNAKILQQAASQTMPDVLMVNNPDLPQFADTGALRPLADLGVDVGDDAFYRSVLDVGSYDGKLYGLAPNVNSLALFYNRRLLAEAGVEVPTTWAELRAAAQALTVGDRHGFAYSAASGTEGTWTFIPFLWSNGGSQLALDAPEAVEAVEFYTGLARDGFVPSSVVNWSQADVKDQFAAGNVAMMINGPWQIPSLEEAEGLDWGITTIPVPEPGAPLVAPLGGELWAAPVTFDDEREAKSAHVVQCMSRPQIQLDTALSNNTVPGRPDVAAQLVQQLPAMDPIVRTTATARPLTSDSGLKWPDVNTAVSRALQAVIIGSADVPTALRQAADSVRAS